MLIRKIPVQLVNLQKQMSNLSRKAVLLLVSISMSGMALAGNSGQAREWLERMATAMNEMDYQGTFVYVRDGVVETMRITHVMGDDGVRERLYSTSGPRREVIRDRNGIRCVLQDSASLVGDPVVMDSYFPSLPLSVFEGDSSGYQLEMGGKTRIAGQIARRVSISPKDNFRYGYDFWLEENTGLLLQWVLFDAEHKPQAKLVFTDFAMGTDINLDELESAAPSEDFVELRKFVTQTAVVLDTTPRWVPRNLPVGFELSSHTQKVGADGVSEHLVYSDGLVAVSVYVEQQSSETDVMQGTSQLGTNNAYSKKQGDLQITVIGEVPAITVKSIANEMALSVASN